MEKSDSETMESAISVPTHKIRKIFIDLGGWKGDTLALYALHFLEKTNVVGEGEVEGAFEKEAFSV